MNDTSAQTFDCHLTKLNIILPVAFQRKRVPVFVFPRKRDTISQFVYKVFDVIICMNFAL